MLKQIPPLYIVLHNILQLIEAEWLIYTSVN